MADLNVTISVVILNVSVLSISIKRYFKQDLNKIPNYILSKRQMLQSQRYIVWKLKKMR